MTCREMTEFLDDYVSGDLATEVRGRFEAHLMRCRDCVAYLRGYQETVGLLRETGQDLADEVPPDVPPELVQAIRAVRRSREG